MGDEWAPRPVLKAFGKSPDRAIVRIVSGCISKTSATSDTFKSRSIGCNLVMVNNLRSDLNDHRSSAVFFREAPQSCRDWYGWVPLSYMLGGPPCQLSHHSREHVDWERAKEYFSTGQARSFPCSGAYGACRPDLYPHRLPQVVHKVCQLVHRLSTGFGVGLLGECCRGCLGLLTSAAGTPSSRDRRVPADQNTQRNAGCFRVNSRQPYPG